MEYTIDRLGHHGDGIAQGPVFAPMTLPGEVVTGRRDGDRLHDVRIVSPSEDRVRPVCTHFKSCGGCQVMHASDDFVAVWKSDVVRRALQAQGIDAPIRPIATSPAQSRRRATFAARRTKSGALVGFHGRASGTLVAIPNCQLLHPDLMASLPIVEEIACLGGSRKAVLAVQVTRSEAGLDISVENGKPVEHSLFSDLAALAERHGIARLSWQG